MISDQTPALVEHLRAFHCTDPTKVPVRELADRVVTYARFHDSHGYGSDDYLRLLRRYSDRKDGDWTCDWCLMGCVQALSDLSDGPALLEDICVDSELSFRIRSEAFDLLALNHKNLDLSGIRWERLIEVVSDDDVRWILRNSAARALALQGRIEALPVIKSVYKALLAKLRQPPRRPDLVRHWFMFALPALGDTEYLAHALDMLFDGWPHNRLAASETLEVLDKRLGGPKKLAEYFTKSEGLPFDEHESIWANLKHHPNPSYRRWALRQREADIDLIEPLGDAEWGLRKEASDALVANRNDGDLRQVFADLSAPRMLRSWAAFTLLRIGHRADVLFPEPDRDQQVELWFRPNNLGLDARVRAAIVRHYAPDSEEGTDVRYFLEAEFSDEYTTEHGQVDLARFVESLTARGFEVDRPRSCGEVQQQGSGTYFIIDYRRPGSPDNFSLLLSTLGPFYQRPENTERRPAPADWKKQEKEFRKLGFVDLTQYPETSPLFPGLNVYLVGSREPISIFDLVFFWMD